MKQRTAGQLLKLIGLLWTSVSLAAPTKSVRVTTYQELAEGQVTGVLLSSQGDARAGFTANRMALPTMSDDSIRAMTTTADGQIFLGSGGDGPAILTYTQGGVRRLGKLDANTWVTALCPLDGPGRGPGEILAATAGDGRLFRVHPDGKSEVVAQLDAEHIWALQRDAQHGVTYVATGPGRLWAIDDSDLQVVANAKTKSRARKLFESDARQFLSLDRGDDGALYVGTADDAVLYRVDPRGGARALHDFAGNEVRAIAHYKDTLYVAVNDMQRGDTALRGTKMVAPAAGTAPGVKPTAPTGSTPPSNPSPTDKKGKGALYRIDPSGRVEQLHAIVDGFFNALAVDSEGNLFAAASTPGGRGRVYWIAPQGPTTPTTTVYTALEVKESDVLTLALRPGKEQLVGTGNSGAVYLLRPQPPGDANYLSKAFYTQSPSHFGRLRYQGQGSLRVETRSGNLAKPDASWSGWQPLQELGQLPATGEQHGKIASPDGRYLQVRVNFSPLAVLSDFVFFYQPINQRPRVTEIQIGEDTSGRVARGIKPTSPLRPRSPLVRLRWKTENSDEDDLNYRVYVRRVGTPAGASADLDSPGWLRLGGPEPLIRAELEWNTETVADGLYELKVLVSDERSNPADLALTHELISPPFLVDNRRPEVRDLAWNAATGTLSGRAVDATSPIADLSYSVDGGEFYPLGPKDGVLDDLAEEFSSRPPRLLPGLHTILVRASDAAENAATGQLVIQVK